jgi:hypothetical protein
MPASELSKLVDELWPWFEALDLVKPGDDGAPLVFAKTLSGVNPNLFTEALKQATKYIFMIFREDARVSARVARLVSERFQKAAGREYERLQLASAAGSTGTA